MTPERDIEEKVHARLVADGLAAGLDAPEALRWADSRMRSWQASAIRLDIAMDDLGRQLRVAADGAGSRVARAFKALR